MAHHVYRTEGFVISSEPRGESDRSFVLLTKDLGKIRARASGTRKLESKIRPFLQEGASLEFSLVKGKTGWRITTVRENPISGISSLINSRRKIFLKALNLSLNYLPNEVKEDKVFEIAHNLFTKIATEEDQNTEEIIEIYSVASLLSNFGLLAKDTNMVELRSDFSTFEEAKENIKKNRRLWIDMINKAIKESSLS